MPNSDWIKTASSKKMVDKRVHICKMFGIEVCGEEEANKELKEIIIRLIKEGKTRRQVRVAIGHSSHALDMLFVALSIDYSALSLETRCTCECGCNMTFTPKKWGGCRRFFSIQHEKKFFRQQIKEGKLEPSRHDVCKICGTSVPVYSELDNKPRETCGSKDCVYKAQFEGRPTDYSNWSPFKGRTPEDRSVCRRRVTEDLVEVFCERYQVACGEGCYRESNEKQTCFIMPKELPRKNLFSAIDPTKYI